MLSVIGWRCVRVFSAEINSSTRAVTINQLLKSVADPEAGMREMHPHRHTKPKRQTLKLKNLTDLSEPKKQRKLVPQNP